MSLKHSVLATLARQPRSGYEIAKNIEGGIGFFWKATHQQIYKDLSALEELGFVSHKEVKQEEAPAKKVYKISASGHRELIRWIVEDRSDAVVRDPFLIKIFAGHLIPPKQILEILSDYRERRLAALDRYLAIERAHFSDPANLSLNLRFQHLVIKRGISHARNWLEWASEVEAFVKGLE